MHLCKIKETATVAIDHELTGQAAVVFVVLKDNNLKNNSKTINTSNNKELKHNDNMDLQNIDELNKNIVLNNINIDTKELDTKIIKNIRKAIGAIAKPYKIIYLKELPKTTTGKIERYKLRKLAQEENNKNNAESSNYKGIKGN